MHRETLTCVPQEVTCTARSNDITCSDTGLARLQATALEAHPRCRESVPTYSQLGALTNASIPFKLAVHRAKAVSTVSQTQCENRVEPVRKPYLLCSSAPLCCAAWRIASCTHQTRSAYSHSTFQLSLMPIQAYPSC